MSSAAAVRFQIETALHARIPGALTPRPRIIRELAACGVPELDLLLGGGLPIGAISELVGPQGSGRTTLALSTLAEMTAAGKSVAWVDTSDALDPESAAAAGVDLPRQLWVRCGALPARPGLPDAVASNAASKGGAALLVEGSYTAAPSGGCGSPHPRGEARGMSEAVDAFLQPDVFSRPAPPRDPAVARRDRMIGTPSAPNRKLTDRTPYDPRPFPRRAKDREEQIPTDRRPTRRQAFHTQEHSAAAGAAATEATGSRHLQAAQIANTAEAAAARQAPRGGAWTDNRNNAAGRCFATPPNAIAAGLPRFREMEARANGQGHGIPKAPLAWQPSLDQLRAQVGTPETAQPRPGPSQSKPGASTQSEPKQTRPDRKPSLLGERPNNLTRSTSPLWHALDQALRATDLLLAAGGFSAIVVDLGSIPPEFSWRIPLATWFRFRAAADRARTVLLLVTQHPCARSSAELVLRLAPAEPQAATTVVTGARFRIAIDRRRFETEPAHTASPAAHPVPPSPATEDAPAGLHLVSSRNASTRKPPQRAVGDQVYSSRTSTWNRSMAWSRACTGTAPEPQAARSGSAREPSC